MTSERCATLSFIYPAIDGLLQRLADYSLLLWLEGGRSTAEKPHQWAGVTAPACPDCCMWLNHDGGLVFMGEDRSSSNGSLAAAIRDLERRMHAQWHPLTLGHLPFLLCYASCGLRVQFCAIMRGTTRAVPVSKELNMLKVWCGRCGETD